MLSPLILCVALGAQLCDGAIKQHMLVLGPVRPVAAQAIERKVLVPRIHDLFADGVG